MPQRFLAAIDFSEHARYAAERAAMLTAEQSGRLELLHVVAKAPLDALRSELRVAPDAAAKLVEDVCRMLDRLAADLTAKTGTAPARRVEIGDVLNVIGLECRRAELLVLGAHGTNPLRDMILGTTAERLLGRCPRPVLVVKRAPRNAYLKVLVPVDLSPRSTSVLRTALRVAPKSAITITHAYDVPFEGKLHLAGVADETIQAHRLEAANKATAAIRDLGESVAGERGRFAHAVHLENPSRSIIETEHKLMPDLIVMGKQGRSMLEEVLVGSVTRHVLGNSRCDVLVVQE